MSHDRSYERRKILQLSALSGSGMLTSGVVGAATQPADSMEDTTSASNDGLSGLAVEEGRVVVDDYRAVSRGSAISLQDTARAINRGIRNGYWKPVQKGEQVFVNVTEVGKEKIYQLLSKNGLLDKIGTPQSGGTLDCDGVTKKTSNGTWFNDDDTGEVADGIQDVARVTALAGLIAGIVLGFPIGLIPAILFAVASYLLLDFSGDLLRINDGCGVIVKEYDFIGWDVRPQDCDC